MEKQTPSMKIDYFLIMIILSLGAISAFTLYSIDPYLPAKYDNINFVTQQLTWYALGAVAIGFIMLLDYDRLRNLTWIIYAIGILLLLGLEFNVPSAYVKTLNGATGWYEIPGIGTFQPAEFMKVFIVITLSHVIVGHQEKFPQPRVKDDFWLLLKIFVIAIIPLGLIAKQPDLGGALVISAIVASMLLVSGIRWRFLLILFGSVAILVSGAIGIYYFFPDLVLNLTRNSDYKHAFVRFYGWLSPQEYASSYGLQLIKAMLAIGSGQLFGKGISNIEVYIPERHTDMIFTAIAEQFGFLGASIVVTLFFLMIYRIIDTALESNDPFGSFLCTGFIGMFTFQVFQNIGMSIQLLPITGLPLPFISYGGSSLVTYMIAIGIVLNVRSRTKVYMFD
ncbi:FtsW/RodA/SpoVE family cell cycle protein [Bacillaceae bacterium S4-13-56]